VTAGRGEECDPPGSLCNHGTTCDEKCECPATPTTPTISTTTTTSSSTTTRHVVTTTSSTTTTLPTPVAHYEYVLPDGAFYVYDMDDGHRLVKTVALPQTRGLRGAIANAPTHSLYISYGGDGNGQNGTPTMLKYDLLTDTVVWTHSYAIGIDSMSITPDGTTIFMPSGELASGGTWYVVSADTGDVVATIDGPKSPHNTIVGPDGTRVYLGGRAYSYLQVADTASHDVIRSIGPLQSSVRPFTINGRETIAYITITGLRGFQIGDVTTGAVLRTVTFTGPNVSTLNGPTCPSHGISLSPDERELYVIDWPDYVHVFDVTDVLARSPRQIADIRLTPSMNHLESPCVYDCGAGGWLQHSRDGRFVYVGDQGDVIDTVSRQPVVNLPTLYDTKKMIEIDWSGGVPVFAANARASVGYVR
jgi:WD40 repeat protein